MCLPDILLMLSWYKKAEQFINLSGEQVAHVLSSHSGHNVSRLAVVTWKGGSHFADDLGLPLIGHTCSLYSYSEVMHKKIFLFIFI